ncbi:MAG: tRNA (adenosine(37)-N6)-dimethylallyltransferase MiaA [Spirochaetota bacterium]
MNAVRAVMIAGATASGKTAFAHDIIERHFPDAAILSADSMQLYRGMDIGTAKPSVSERSRFNYHLIDHVDPHTDFSVADYVSAASAVLAGTERLFIVGGTGLYMRALMHGMFTETDDGGEIRSRLESEAREKGIAHLYRRLADVDPSIAAKISPTHERRIVRALEVFEKTGTPMSVMQSRRTPLVPLVSMMFCMHVPRTVLYPRINERVTSMFARGLIDEVRGLLASGVTAANTSMQGIGYKETAAHLAGGISYDALVDTVQMNTRRYAKRQETWFRRDEAAWISPDDEAAVSRAVEEMKRLFGQ